MAGRTLTSIEGVKGPSIKRQKTIPLKITDVNDDCLERIFDYLNANDLNNVAEATRRFVPAARMVYRRKYSDQVIVIRGFSRNISFIGGGIIKAKPITFLQHFGVTVKKLKLYYAKNGRHSDADRSREMESLMPSNAH